MAVKKIIQNAFEQVIESSKDIAKSSAKQIVQTVSPWEMIRNSFDSKGEQPENGEAGAKLKEMQAKADGHTPLNFDSLNKSYADQDKKKIDQMKQRLFQIVKRDEENSSSKGKRDKAEKERSILQEENDSKARDENRRRQQSLGAPQGKIKGRRKKPSEPQPAETKPGSSKQ